MSIQPVLNGIISHTDQSYATLAHVVDKAYVELSFWGTPNVYAIGYTGCVSLQELAEKVRALVDSHPQFSTEERAIGKAIQDRVSVLYDMSNDQYNRVGFIRSLAFAVIEYYTSRSLHLKGAVDKAQTFDYYTLEQFQETYMRDPGSEDYKSSFCQGNGQISVPVWRAPEWLEKQVCPDRKKEGSQKNVQSALNEIIPYNKDSSYETFTNIVDKAYVELSFWGNRNVYSLGYTGCISLQELAEKVRALVDSHPQFSAEERKIGKVIQDKISVLDDISWNQYQRVRFIRGFFFTIIGVITQRSSCLIDAMDDAHPFNYYTAQQYRETYGKEPNHRDPTGSFCRGEGQVPVQVWMEKQVRSNQ